MARIVETRRPYAALAFNGTTTFLTSPVAPSATSFSMAFWYKSRTHTSNSRVIDYQIAGPEDGFTFNQVTTAPNRLQIVIRQAATVTATLNLDNLVPGKWHHIILTYTTGGSSIAYVDSVSTTSDPNTVMTAAAATLLTLGRRAPTSTSFFTGELAEFLLFNGKVLTQTEINDLYFRAILPSGVTTSYFFMNNVNDSSGNGNTGTLTSGTYETYPNTRIPNVSISNKSLSFANGVTKKITVADTAALRMETLNTFSWTAWIYINNISENALPRIMAKGQHYLCIMGTQTNAQKNRLALEVVNQVDSVATEYWGSSRLTANRWYHVAVTFDNITGVVYLNGVPELMTTLIGPYISPLFSTSGNDLIIGNNNTDTRNFCGSIRNARQHNVALTAAEVLTLAKGGEVARGLVGKWDMTEGSGSSVADTSGNSFIGTITAANWENRTNTRSLASGRVFVATRSAA